MTRHSKFKKLVRAKAKAAGTNYRTALGSMGPTRFDSVELRLNTSERQPELFFRPLKSDSDDSCAWAEEVRFTVKPIERAVRQRHPELLEDFALWSRMHRQRRAPLARSLPADRGGWRRVGLREARRAAFDVLLESIEHVGWRYFLRADIDGYLEAEDTLDDALQTEVDAALRGMNAAQWAAAAPLLENAKRAARSLMRQECGAALRDADAALSALGWSPEPVMMPQELMVGAEPPDVVMELVWGPPPMQSVVMKLGERYRVRATADSQLNVGRPCQLVCFGAQENHENFAWVKFLDNGRRGAVGLYDLEKVEDAAAAA